MEQLRRAADLGAKGTSDPNCWVTLAIDAGDDFEHNGRVWKTLSKVTRHVLVIDIYS